MTFTKFAIVAVSICGFAASTASAQSLRSNTGPAEFPPSDYTASQYVDSTGCVYIRAGVDGAVEWVPRVTRDRKIVCGAEPTLRTVRANAPLEINGAVEVSAPLTNSIAPQPTLMRRAPATVSATSQVQKQQTRHAPAKNVTLVRRPVAPQTVTLAEATSSGMSLRTRVMPKHVYLNRQQAKGLKVPHGYKFVWEDDRMNPRRAEQNLAGIIATKLVWTDTVPRRLIDPATGRDLTGQVALVYPYTDVVSQRAELGEVTLLRKDGKTYKRIVRNAGAQPVMSSRSNSAPARQDQFDGR